MDFKGNLIYFLDNYSDLEDKQDMKLLYIRILEKIRIYNEQIFYILQEENIYDEPTQRKIVDYQNNKTDLIIAYNTIRRRVEINQYFRNINKARNKGDLEELKIQLDQQRINAKEEDLLFTNKEKEIILEKIEKKIRQLELIRRNKKRKFINYLKHQL